jgi:quinol monooxygenase YgiN
VVCDSVAECQREAAWKEDVKMVKQVVRLTVNFIVSEEQLEEFKSIAQSMTEVSKAEPGTLGYEWFASADGKRFRLVETYVDSAALEAHFLGPAVQQWVPKLVAVCKVNGFEIYGDPGPKVAEMAGGFGAVVFQYWLGIDR